MDSPPFRTRTMSILRKFSPSSFNTAKKMAKKMLDFRGVTCIAKAPIFTAIPFAAAIFFTIYAGNLISIYPAGLRNKQIIGAPQSPEAKSELTTNVSSLPQVVKLEETGEAESEAVDPRIPPFNVTKEERMAWFRNTLFDLKWPLASNHTLASTKNITTVKSRILTSSGPTNLSHIVFGVVGSMNTWRNKRPYVEAWWRPNVTRGYLFLDRPPTQEFQPWPSSSPPFRVNEDITKFDVYPKLVNPSQVRIVRTILETFREGDKDVRWYVMADDDTLLFVDNLVELLAQYDDAKFFYIGANSECVKSNSGLSFEMAFGGAGYALSYPLAEALARKLDGCIERYPHLHTSDFILHSCLADIGVALTIERGFHQVDLRGDISGLLSAHPQSPALSIHHIDSINPFFPSINRSESINHLMKAANVDHTRLLQQTICYQREKNWSFSISWGYSAHVYESIHPRSFLRRPLETFKPWKRSRPPFYMFNTRRLTNNSCEAPHVFFLQSIEIPGGNQVVTVYTRASPRNLPPCSSSGNHSADSTSKIRVLSPANRHKELGVIECCDVEQRTDMNVAYVKLRSCMKDEIISR